ncbi:MAG: hypothetical protein QG650_987 [Patescibacteria group bacterium]|nr:hypothetical protein [Patescibacteria group bacterium]
MYAELRPEYRATLTDVERPTYVPEKAAGADSEMSESEKLRTLRLQAGLEHVRKYKAEEGSELFEEMKAKGHSVVDRFPDKENGES